MSEQQKPEKVNQYEMILAITEYIRQNPDSPVVARFKQCKSQSEQIILFESLSF